MHLSREPICLLSDGLIHEPSLGPIGERRKQRACKPKISIRREARLLLMQLLLLMLLLRQELQRCASLSSAGALGGARCQYNEFERGAESELNLRWSSFRRRRHIIVRPPPSIRPNQRLASEGALWVCARHAFERASGVLGKQISAAQSLKLRCFRRRAAADNCESGNDDACVRLRPDLTRRYRSCPLAAGWVGWDLRRAGRRDKRAPRYLATNPVKLSSHLSESGRPVTRGAGSPIARLIRRRL